MSSIADRPPLRALSNASTPAFAEASAVPAARGNSEPAAFSFALAPPVVLSSVTGLVLMSPPAASATAATALTSAQVPPRAPTIDLSREGGEGLEKVLDCFTNCFVALDYKQASWSSKARRSLQTLASLITSVLPRAEFYTLARRMVRLPGDDGFDVRKLTQAWRDACVHVECGTSLRLILEHYKNRILPCVTEVTLYWLSLPPGLHLTDNEKTLNVLYHGVTVDGARPKFTASLDNEEQIRTDLYNKIRAMMSAHPGWEFEPTADQHGNMNFEWYCA